MAVLAPAVRIDLASLTNDEISPILLSELDRLQPEELMTLVGSAEQLRDAGKLLRERRAGTYEWTPLAPAADGRAQVEVARRAAASGTPREILEALAWDHDRLDALENAAFAQLEAGDVHGATDTFSKFAFGLDRHIRFEEELLFPAFEDAACIPPHAGPTAVMRHEHVEIRNLLWAIGTAIAKGGSPELRALRGRFHDLLGGHNDKEEQVLYPSVDRMLGPEADGLMARIQMME
jgi:regulator of cell morphogenesis and NO signaling